MEGLKRTSSKQKSWPWGATPSLSVAETCNVMFWSRFSLPLFLQNSNLIEGYTLFQTSSRSNNLVCKQMVHIQWLKKYSQIRLYKMTCWKRAAFRSCKIWGFIKKTVNDGQTCLQSSPSSSWKFLNYMF